MRQLVKAQELTDMNVLGSECEAVIDQIWEALQAAVEMASGYELKYPSRAEIYKWLNQLSRNT